MMETGINLDLDDLSDLLAQIGRLIEVGFGEEEIAKVTRAVERQKIDTTKEFTFAVRFAGNICSLRISVFLDDVDSPDLSFFGDEVLLDRIRQELVKFAEQKPKWVPPEPLSEEERLRRKAEIQARSARAWAPILAELQEAGFAVQSPKEIADGKLTDKKAIGILIEWLHKAEPAGVKFAIAKGITAPGVRPVPRKDVVRAFEEAVEVMTYDSSNKWQLGNLIGKMASKSELDDLIRIVKDKRHGKSREMIASGLGRIRDERAVDALLGLLENEDLVGHALEGLGKLKARRAIPMIEKFRDHPMGWVRREARKAIEKTNAAGSEI